MAIPLQVGELANGSIGQNSRKKPGSKSPDFTGTINTPDGEFRISAWALTNKTTGEHFISFSIRDPGAQKEPEVTPADQKDIAGVFDMLFKAPKKGKK